MFLNAGLFGGCWAFFEELKLNSAFAFFVWKRPCKGEQQREKKHTILMKKLMKEHSTELNGHQAHVLSFLTLRSR